MSHRGNQRPPMLNIQNKNENAAGSKMKNSQNKMIDQNVMYIDDNKINTNSINNLSHSKGYSIARDDKTASLESSEKQFADGEFIKNIQKALQSAINENEDLREKIKLLIKENSELKEDIEDKNFALIELAQFYEFCQKNHKNCIDENGDNEKKMKNKRKSKSL